MFKIETAEFVKSCTTPEQYPRYPHPEFAFLGRSNSGKSSLINMLTGRRRLVRTGGSPGVTRTINFFLLNKNISVADLPGYGYAKLPKPQRESFARMISEYLTVRENLKTAFLLIDIRRDIEDEEIQLIHKFLKGGTPFGIILTKADKLSSTAALAKHTAAANALGISTESVICASSKSGAGKKELLQIISGRA